MEWILDDGPFGTLVSAQPSIDLSTWPEGELFVAPATSGDASKDKSGRRPAALKAKSSVSGSSVITVFDFPERSNAWFILYSHLRKNTGGSANLAEHQSIAWLLDSRHRDAVLVTQDKFSAFLALAELGRSRVCHPFELWHHLFTAGRLSREQYRDLMERTLRRGSQGLPGFPWRFLPLP